MHFVIILQPLSFYVCTFKQNFKNIYMYVWLLILREKFGTTGEKDKSLALDEWGKQSESMWAVHKID